MVRELTSFEELRVQVGQATGDRVGQPTAADPVVGLDAQVTAERALRGSHNGLGEIVSEKQKAWGWKDDWKERTDHHSKSRFLASEPGEHPDSGL